MKETEHTLPLDTSRGRQVVSKRDVVKTNSASHSSKLNRRGNSHSLEQKVAALKDAEIRSEMELNKTIETLCSQGLQKEKPKAQNSPQKQRKPRKSL